MSITIFSLIMISNTIVSLLGLYIGSVINSKNKSIILILYKIAAGMMTGIVCFEMIPDSMEIGNIYLTILGLFLGIALTLLLDILINFKNEKKSKTASILIILSMSIHNIVEGVSIGSSFVYLFSLGISLFISNILHDIPESIIVGMSVNSKNISKLEKIINAVLLGIPTTLGVLIGYYIGNISNFYIALSLAISGGSMLYIVSCDLIPNSKVENVNKFIDIFYIIGIILALIVTN